MGRETKNMEYDFALEQMEHEIVCAIDDGKSEEELTAMFLEFVRIRRSLPHEDA